MLICAKYDIAGLLTENKWYGTTGLDECGQYPVIANNGEVICFDEDRFAGPEVILHYNDDVGERLWVVEDYNDREYWITSCPIKKDAIKFCNKHGLKIMAIKNDFK